MLLNPASRYIKNVVFLKETEYLLYRDIKVSPEVLPSEHIAGYQEKFRAGILDLDRKISGEDRIDWLEPLLKDSLVYCSQNTIEGFYLPGGGEGTVLAVTSAAGLELSRQRLATKDFAAFPADNFQMKGYLAGLGYEPFRVLKRMRFGPAFQFQPENIYNRIGGNLG